MLNLPWISNRFGMLFWSKNNCDHYVPSHDVDLLNSYWSFACTKAETFHIWKHWAKKISQRNWIRFSYQDSNLLWFSRYCGLCSTPMVFWGTETRCIQIKWKNVKQKKKTHNQFWNLKSGFKIDFQNMKSGFKINWIVNPKL